MTSLPNLNIVTVREIIDFALKNTTFVDGNMSSLEVKQIILSHVGSKGDFVAQTKKWNEQLTFDHEFLGKALTPYLEIVDYLHMCIAPEVTIEKANQATDWQKVLTLTAINGFKLSHFGMTSLTIVKDAHGEAMGKAASFLTNCGFEIELTAEGPRFTEKSLIQ